MGGCCACYVLLRFVAFHVALCCPVAKLTQFLIVDIASCIETLYCRGSLACYDFKYVKN